MLRRTEAIFTVLLGQWGCSLSEFSGEADHLHLLIEAKPAVSLARSSVGNLKTVSSPLLRRKYAELLRKFF
jgi:putative transposase